jgi:type I restriction enzyme S subunit
LAALEVPLPNYEEQTRIARILSTMLEARDAAKRVLGSSLTLTTSVRSEVFTDRYPNIFLSDLVDPNRPVCYGIVQPGPAVLDGIPYINVVDILNGKILMGQLKRTSKEIDERYKRTRVAPGDVILTIRGTHDRVTQVPDDAPALNLSRGCARVSTGGALPARYLYHWLQTTVAQSFLRDHFRGVALRQVNIGDVNRMPVPTPPYDTAVSIARQLDAVENHCARLRAEVESLDALFWSALSSLMGSDEL